MKKWVIASTLVGVLIAWWNMAVPGEEIGCYIAAFIAFNPATVQKIAAIDHNLRSFLLV